MLLEKSALKQSFVDDTNTIISKEFTLFFAKVTDKTHFFHLLFFHYKGNKIHGFPSSERKLKLFGFFQALLNKNDFKFGAHAKIIESLYGS